MAPDDTKERILDTAESLFADHGFAGTSLRAITQDAEVNLAAVNYHFGSKDELIQAVFERRIARVNEERIEMLDAHERAAQDASPPLDAIVDAFLEPVLRRARDPEWATFMRLVGHTSNEPSEKIREMFYSQFQEVGRRFMTALRRALPALDAEEVFWRLLFTAGVMAHTLSMSTMLPRLLSMYCGERQTLDPERLKERMACFVLGGLTARPADGGA